MYRSEKEEYVPLQTDRNKQDKARQVPRTDRIAADMYGARQENMYLCRQTGTNRIRPERYRELTG